MHGVIIVPAPGACERAGVPGGLSLLERQVKQLRALGCEPPLVLVPEGDPAPRLGAGLAVAGVHRVPRGSGDAAAMLAAAADTLPDDMLVVTADRLVDLRVLRAVAATPAPAVVTSGGRVEAIGHVGAADLRQYGAAWTAQAGRVAVEALDPYAPELRGHAPPYVLAVATADERRRAWRVLLDAVQKRTLDLPGQYFDTPFENALVRRLAPTGVTPNQITILTLVLAAYVAWLFASGRLGVGLVLALVVGVLDGVDGKLARMKLQTSKLGELEHVGDFLYENAWYLTLGWSLSSVYAAPPLWWASWVLVACDLADSLLYGALRARTGVMLDELATFDGRFRRVAGRRNVYVWMLIGGTLLGRPVAGFLTAVAWACCTVAVHSVRVVAGLRAASADRQAAGRVSTRADAARTP